MHEDEIETFYCRHCLDSIPVVEAAQNKNKCSKYLECPLCFSIIQITVSASHDKFYFYVCNFCKWDTIAVNLKARNVNALLHKFSFYKGKFQLSPQQDMFNKLLDVLKFNIDEQISIEKQEMRAKKKSIPLPVYFTTSKGKKGGRKFTMEDLQLQLDEKKQALREDKRLISFFEIYLNKKEAEQREIQARSSVYDGNSPRGSEASTTPLSALGIGNKGFFKEQPTTTKNLSLEKVDKPLGANKPVTPKALPGLDLSKIDASTNALGNLG